ncbi:MAG: hypothetical protein ACK5LJ_11010 [Paracoccus sp. (in: a-proteobacteria)]
MNEVSGLGYDLLGTFAVAIGAAALIYALGHALRRAGRPLPGWALPAGIGVAILAYATWNEYSWASRVETQLPEGYEVIARGETSSALRPWTYFAPPVSRLAVINPAALRGDGEGAQVLPVLLLERWKRSITVEQGIDCAGGKVRPPESGWVHADASDPSFNAVCGG